MSHFEDGKQTMTISKRYGRKVNLSAISSQYDNVSMETFISCDVEVDDIEKVKEKMRKMHSLVVSETERDIREIFIRLMDMARDKDNLAVIGTGKTLKIEDSSETKPKEIKKEIKVEKKKVLKEEELEEIDFNSFDPSDYEAK